MPTTTNARKGDPVTSHLAAAHMEDSGQLSRQCRAVLELVKQHPGLTSFELSECSTQFDRYQIARRLADLAKANKVAKASEPRPCQVTRRQAYPWIPLQ
jgi:hypothetical protein